jgi:cytochrome c oxidase assembly protein subunit 19
MASGGTFGGARGYQPRPPEKGVFPLDHFGECKHVKEEYMACLKDHQNDTSACTRLARKYLECRMDNRLMAKQDLSELGFKDKDSDGTSDSSGKRPSKTSKEKDQDRQKTGFVAGLQVASRKIEK